jgi:hypothetical protein
VKERGILYSAPMVLAKLAGRKTQTRRVAKFQFYEGQNPDFGGYTPGTYMTGGTPGTWVLRSRGAGSCWNDRTQPLDCPYGKPGERLWGREAWGLHSPSDPTDWFRESLKKLSDEAFRASWEVAYRASWDVDDGSCFWRPSIFMRRQHSRILDEVLAVRVERLQDISEADARAEGLEPVRSEIEQGQFGDFWRWPGGATLFDDPRSCYFAGWDTINGAGAAAKNPWVWAVTTRPV